MRFPPCSILAFLVLFSAVSISCGPESRGTEDALVAIATRSEVDGWYPADDWLWAQAGWDLEEWERRVLGLMSDLAADASELEDATWLTRWARLNRYAQLDALGVRLKLPDVGSCGVLQPPLGCAQPVSACVTDLSQYGSGGGTVTTYAVVRLTDQVPSRDDELRDELWDGPSAQFPFDTDPPVEPVAAATLLIGETHEIFCRHDDCYLGSLPEGACRIVYANGCAGTVGFVCTEDRHSGQWTLVGEVRLSP